MAECDKCMNEQRILALEADKERNSAQHKEFYGKIGNIEIEDAKKGTVLSQIVEKLDKIDAKMDAIESRPAKKWDMVSNEIIKWGILALLGAAVYFK